MNNMYREEIKEAIRACDNVVVLLDRSKRAINAAQGLGFIDLLGGKTFITFLKRMKINKAEKELAKAKRAVNILNKELVDVEQIVNVNFEIGFILTFLDYFFGGPIADWIVLGKLGDGKRKLNQAKSQVLDIRTNLEELLHKYN